MEHFGVDSEDDLPLNNLPVGDAPAWNWEGQGIEDYEKCIKIRDIIKGEEFSKIAWDLLKSWGVKGEIININQNKDR